MAKALGYSSEQAVAFTKAFGDVVTQLESGFAVVNRLKAAFETGGAGGFFSQLQIEANTAIENLKSLNWGQIIDDIKTQFTQKGNELWTWIQTTAPEATRQIGVVVAEMSKAIGIALVEHGPEIIAFMALVWMGVQQWLLFVALPALASLAFNMAVGFVEGFIQGITGQKISLEQAIQMFPQVVQTLGPQILSKAAYLAAQFIVGFREAVPALIAALSEIWQILENFITGAVNAIPGQTKSIGKGIVDGIKQGVSEAWDGLVSYLESQLSSLPYPMKKFLGISSPSKVMADQVGQWIPKGIQMGIEDNMGGLMGAISQMGDLVTRPALGSAVAGAGAAGGMASTTSNVYHVNIQLPESIIGKSPEVVAETADRFVDEFMRRFRSNQ